MNAHLYNIEQLTRELLDASKLISARESLLVSLRVNLQSILDDVIVLREILGKIKQEANNV